MKFRSWLLIQESPNEDLEFLLKDLGLFARLDLTERPLAALRMRDGEAVLSAPRPDDFFDRVFENQVVEAFSTAPLADLRALHKKVFFHRARFVQLFCHLEDPPLDADPYYRRRIRIQYLASSLQGDFDMSLTRVEKGPIGDSFPVFIDPVPIDIDERHVQRLLGSNAIALRGISGALLPLARVAESESYFSEERIGLREGLLEIPGFSRRREAEATALTLWRLFHDPLVRDLITEGAAFRFDCVDGQPTSLRLEVQGLQSPDPIQAYRTGLFFRPQEMPGAAWAPTAAAAIAADLRQMHPLGLEVVPATGEPVSIHVPSPRNYEASSLAEGSWQRLEMLKRELPETRLRQRFDELVLWPSRSRGSAAPDHDLAERQFIANFWRCPWAQSTDRSAWRYALLELLRHELAGFETSPAERVQSWNDDGWPWIEEGSSATMPVVVHRPGLSEDEAAFWRLLLPVGTVLKSGGTFRLDDVSSRLDRGFVLA